MKRLDTTFGGHGGAPAGGAPAGTAVTEFQLLYDSSGGIVLTDEDKTIAANRTEPRPINQA